MNNDFTNEVEIEQDSQNSVIDSLKEGILSHKFKSIQKKLEFYLIGAFTTFTVIVCGITIVSAYDSTIVTLEKALKVATTESATNFSRQLEVFQLCMKDISQYSAFDDVSKNKKEIIEILENKSDEYWCYTSFITSDGYDIRTGEFLGGADYFTGAIGGSLHVSTPTTINGSNVMPISYPAYHDNVLIGVLYLTPDVEYMFYLLDLVPVSENSHKYIINSKGEYILSNNPSQFIGNNYNPLNDSNVTSYEKTTMQMAIQGELGFDNYLNSDGYWISTTFCPIPNTDGWILVSGAHSLDFISRLVVVMVISILICIFISAIIVFQVRKSINNFIKPIDVCINRVAELATGDVTSPVEIFETGDEVEQLSRCLHEIKTNLSMLVDDESYLLNKMASGDFSVESKHPEIYIGDYAPLLVSINKILDDMNNALYQISTASVEVTFGSENVSTSAQSLAMGAHSQEQSSEALLNSFEQISSGIVISSEKAIKAQQLTDRTGIEVKIGNAHMSDLRQAMADIYDSSQQISNIINSIKDVALQTNILSLNAAVEAARAGAAGAGFAVVAEEVRELALRSSRSAKDTEKLITATLEAVERGSQITNSTADSLDVIVSCIEEAIIAINDIAGTMTDQTTEVKVVIRSLEEISEVINNTSCTSQESAAVSEELSAQAQALSNLVMKFNLKK